MNNKKISSQKKAQIAVTLTWFSAMIVIFFILMLYLSLTVIAVKKKEYTTGKNTLTLEKDLASQEIQRELFNILNSPFKEGQIKIALIQWRLSEDSALQKEISDKIDSLIGQEEKNQCVLFRAYEIKDDVITEEIYLHRGIDPIEREMGLSNNIQTSGANIFFKDRKITTGFYRGKC